MKTPIRKKVAAIGAISLVCSSMLLVPGLGSAASGGAGIPGEGNKWPTIKMKRAVASFYDPGRYEGACGKKFVSQKHSVVAHKSLPCGTKILFSRNGSQEIGVVQDRGPYIGGRTFDLSYKLAKRLGFVNQGVATVRYRIVG